MSEDYRVSTLCRVMKVTRSRFYNWKAAQKQTADDPDAKILQIITTLRQNKRYLCYGSRRLRAFVVNLGIGVSRKRVRKIMKKYDLKVNYKRSFRPSTTDSRHNLPVADNLLDRNFSADQKNQKWAGDITYIRSGSEFVYLAVVMDLYSRKIVGWSVSASMHTQLVADALTMGFKMRGKPAKVLFHSDRGSQYASAMYRELLKSNKMVQSMSRKGNCWDNSPLESFFATLKKEANLCNDMDINRIQIEVFEYIAVFYNRLRSHSYLEGDSPEAFEINQQTLAKSA